jgi:hypothetical protein
MSYQQAFILLSCGDILNRREPQSGKIPINNLKGVLDPNQYRTTNVVTRKQIINSPDAILGNP